MIIRFEFHGGCTHGEVVEADPDVAGNPVGNYMFLTNGGRVGARFREYPFDPELEALRDELLRWSAERTQEIKELMDPSADIADRANWFKAIVLAVERLEKSEPLVWFNGAVRSRDEAERLVMEAQDRLSNRPSQIYEVTRRESSNDGWLVRVEFVSDDESGQLHWA